MPLPIFLVRERYTACSDGNFSRVLEFRVGGLPTRQTRTDVPSTHLNCGIDSRWSGDPDLLGGVRPRYLPKIDIIASLSSRPQTKVVNHLPIQLHRLCIRTNRAANSS